MLQKGGARNRKDNTYSFSPFWLVDGDVCCVRIFFIHSHSPDGVNPKEKMDAAEIDATYSNSQRSQ